MFECSRFLAVSLALPWRAAAIVARPRSIRRLARVGVIDSAPASVAPTVAAMLTDENVFALLDTAYSAMIATDRLAQSKTTGAVNDFATKAVSENAVTRSGIKSTGRPPEYRAGATGPRCHP